MIIPVLIPFFVGFFQLAKKLKECNVFGVSSDEYLNYAVENREEWTQKGEDIVKQLMAKYGAVEKNAADQGTPFMDVLEEVLDEDDRSDFSN